MLFHTHVLQVVLRNDLPGKQHAKLICSVTGMHNQNVAKLGLLGWFATLCKPDASSLGIHLYCAVELKDKSQLQPDK
jgi:hypothetical protein